MALTPEKGRLQVTWFLEGLGLSESQGWGQRQALWVWPLSTPVSGPP